MKVLSAQTMKMQTYTDAIENLLSQSVMLPSELIRDAVRWRLRFLKERYEYLEIPKEEYEKLQSAIKEMEMPFSSVNDFVDQQIRSLLEKYAEWIRQKEEYEKKGRRKE
jgi:hypothetical protein